MYWALKSTLTINVRTWLIIIDRLNKICSYVVIGQFCHHHVVSLYLTSMCLRIEDTAIEESIYDT